MRGDGLMNPNAKCPVCGEPVYYYESPNGGQVYFDELGSPWPKHPCTKALSANINSLDELVKFTEADLSPTAAMLWAAELIKYAMADFRKPYPVWPSEDLAAARSEVLDWMFRSHSANKNEHHHLPPRRDILQLVNYIENSEQQNIRLAQQSLIKLMEKTESPHSQYLKELWTSEAKRAKATLAVMAKVRAHYGNKEFSSMRPPLVTKD